MADGGKEGGRILGRLLRWGVGHPRKVGRDVGAELALARPFAGTLGSEGLSHTLGDGALGARRLRR